VNRWEREAAGWVPLREVATLVADGYMIDVATRTARGAVSGVVQLPPIDLPDPVPASLVESTSTASCEQRRSPVDVDPDAAFVAFVTGHEREATDLDVPVVRVPRHGLRGYLDSGCGCERCVAPTSRHSCGSHGGTWERLWRRSPATTDSRGSRSAR
jgi:hypothetical protein